MDGLTATDALALSRTNENGEGGGFLYVLMLFILLFAGGNWGFGNNNGTAVTEAVLCNSNNFMELQNSVARLNDQATNIMMNEADRLNTLGSAVALANSTLSQQIANNKADNDRAIGDLALNMSQMFAAVNSNVTEQNNKILTAMKDDKIEALQAKINQLELANQMQSVVRFPTATTYGAGFNPFLNPSACNCGASF